MTPTIKNLTPDNDNYNAYNAEDKDNDTFFSIKIRQFWQGQRLQLQRNQKPDNDNYNDNVEEQI